ncbi:antitoxin VapB family protein [Halapricum desulfuricans]|uniref:antitoxin VapB family protein n=1 Tax=Halapricum desulfuricans TaxID=2841257 RepID=UPI001E4C06A9|nr:antitoxin VapB family protein [Halapricum desulfuricans]
MSTSIRISEKTKRKLEAVKRDDETFDELLDRIVVDRTEADVERLLGRAGAGIDEHMKRKNEELSESLADDPNRD